MNQGAYDHLYDRMNDSEKEYVPKKIEKGKNQLEKYHLHRILNLFDAFYLSDVLNTLETVFTKVYVHCTRQIS